MEQPCGCWNNLRRFARFVSEGRFHCRRLHQRERRTKPTNQRGAGGDLPNQHKGRILYRWGEGASAGLITFRRNPAIDVATGNSLTMINFIFADDRCQTSCQRVLDSTVRPRRRQYDFLVHRRTRSQLLSAPQTSQSRHYVRPLSFTWRDPYPFPVGIAMTIIEASVRVFR